MALATRNAETIPTEFGDIVCAIEYDNVLLRVTGVLCTNPTPNNVFISITRDSDGKEIDHTFGPGNTRIDVSTGVASRITLTLNSRGGFDGYTFGATYPA